MREMRCKSASSLSSMRALNILPSMNMALGYTVRASSRARWFVRRTSSWKRRLMTSRRRAPRRMAGRMGVFWRRLPSTNSWSPTRTAGNRTGIAAEARQWAAVTGVATTLWPGSTGHDAGRRPDRVCTNTVVRPVASSVAATLTACKCPRYRLSLMPRHGMRPRTMSSRWLESTSPPMRWPWRSPMRITAPLPNCFSMLETASSIAFAFPASATPPRSTLGFGAAFTFAAIFPYLHSYLFDVPLMLS